MWGPRIANPSKPQNSRYDTVVHSKKKINNRNKIIKTQQ